MGSFLYIHPAWDVGFIVLLWLDQNLKIFLPAHIPPFTQTVPKRKYIFLNDAVTSLSEEEKMSQKAFTACSGEQLGHLLVSILLAL